MLSHAVDLIARGFWVFPITPGKKAPPVVPQWPERSVNHPFDAMELWEEFPNANIGIFTGRFREDAALIAVDVDVKDGRDGDLTVLDLALEGCAFPPTYTQVTPTGGRHLVYCTAVPVKSGVNVLGPGVDIRSAGGYIVGAGSVIGRTEYTGSAHPVAEAPDWLVQRLQVVGRNTLPILPPPFVDEQQAELRATAYLKTEAPAIQGEGGDHHTFRVAARCKDFGCSESVTLYLMDTYWNPRCEPPWDPIELPTKIHNAYLYGSDALGSKAPEADFNPVPVPASLGDPVDELNRQYAHCLSGGSQVILWETTDEHRRAVTDLLSVEAFRGRLANQSVQIGNGKSTPVADLWFRSPKRKTYDKIIFDPSGNAEPRFYNLWKGFSYAPADSWRHPAVEMFLEHAKLNVCGGDPVLYDWLMSYFAHMIQRPWEKPLVALVFRGGKGVGKNALIERVGALLADNFLVAAGRRYLMGNFNSHLERLLLFVLDEAFWSGDKHAEGVLKDLITGKQHTIERKGMEPYKIANLTRICVIGNEEWVVPTTEDERRFAVFTVTDGRKQDTKFFTAMREGMEQGGYPHLLAFLQQYKITADINVAPQTEGLRDQKHASLDPVYQWWVDSLTAGSIVGSDLPGWPEQMDCEVVRNAYQRYAQKRRITARAPSDRAFNGLLAKCARSCTRGRSTTMVGDGRPYVFKFVSLEASRGEWETFIGHGVGWGEG